MNRAMVALTSLGVGTGLMYVADPIEGRRRRARLRDVTMHASRMLQAAVRTTSRDLKNRLSGLTARTQSWFGEETTPFDDVLVARVRARVGRLVSHPGAIEVKSSEGIVTLSGPIFQAEVEQLLAGVKEVPGVTGIDNHLAPHAQAADVSALQGPGPVKIHGARPGWARWTPTTRLLAGAAGLGLMALASRHRSTRGAAAGLAGFELLEQAMLHGRAGARNLRVS